MKPNYEDVMILVPVYNEAKRIAETVKDLNLIFPNIIVVNDGSEDTTLEKTRNLDAKVISHPVNLGQGAALDTGFKYFIEHTEFKYVVTFDSDGQHNKNDAFKMVDFAKSKRLEAVIGTRFARKSSIRKIPFLKRITLRLAILYEKIFYSIDFTDAHNGIRVLSRDLVRLHLVPIINQDMAHATEIAYKICRSTLPYSEYPVSISYTNTKSQSPLNSINIIFRNIFLKL